MVPGAFELMAAIQPMGLLWDIGLIIVTATIFNFIARALKQPPLLAYIIAGLLIGPWGIPMIADQMFGMEIQLLAGEADNITLLSELGVAFLLFSVGIETDLQKLQKLSGTVLIGGTIQVLLTAGFVFGIMTFFQALTFMESIYLALILSFSSTMLVVKLLSDTFSIDTMQGRLMIGFLLVQDVLIVILLPMVGNIENLFSASFFAGFALSGAVLIGLALVLSRYIYPIIFRFSMKSSEMLYLSALSTCFVFMFLSEFILHIPLAIGAFIAGISLSLLPYNFQIYDEIRGIRDFFVTIFFVTLGLQLSFNFLGPLWWLVLFSLAIVLILKPILFYAISYFTGYGKRVSMFVALGLSQASEFSFILATQGLMLGVFGDDFYSATVFVIAFSMVITPYIFTYSDKFYRFFNKLSGVFPKKFRNKQFYHKVSWLEEGKKTSNHIVIVGGGVVGGSLAKALNGKYPLIAMDQNPDNVEKLKKQKINIFLGEADNKLLWKKLALEKARLLVEAIPNTEASLKLMNFAKEINPELIVFARAHSFEEAAQLYEAGADFVCMPEVVGSNVFLKTIMEYLDTNTLYHINVLHDEIIQYLKEHSKSGDKKLFTHPKNWV